MPDQKLTKLKRTLNIAEIEGSEKKKGDLIDERGAEREQ
jgi:hypothetical protein